MQNFFMAVQADTGVIVSIEINAHEDALPWCSFPIKHYSPQWQAFISSLLTSTPQCKSHLQPELLFANTQNAIKFNTQYLKKFNLWHKQQKFLKINYVSKKALGWGKFYLPMPIENQKVIRNFEKINFKKSIQTFH